MNYEYRTVTGDYTYPGASTLLKKYPEPGWELWEYAPHYWFWRRPISV